MARCTVTQTDSHTIRVDADGGSLRIPYRFFWDGHEREPESVVLEETKGRHEVRAFFLFGTIRDTVGCDAHGIIIDRTWSVMSIGTVRLTLDLEFDLPAPAVVLFPGVAAIGVADPWSTFPGDRTSYPLSAFVRGGRTEALIWSERPSMGGEQASIGTCRVVREDEPPSVRVQVRAPGIGEPVTRVGPRPGDVEQPVDSVIQAQGDLVVSHRVCVAFSPAGAIQARGVVSVLARSAAAAAAAAAGPPAEETAERPAVDRERLREALSACFSTHLYQAGGVAGLRETPGSPRLSVSAGLGAAVLARRLFPGDERMEELARRLADFALKGQHPEGLFFTAYDERAGEWTGVRGKPKHLLLSAADAARSADSLLAFSEDLAADGLPHEKYWLAGLRFVEFFIDPKARLCLPGSLHAPDERTPAEPGIGGMGLFSPLARVYGRTRRDRHRKPLDELARRFSAAAWNAFDPPCLRGGRGADAEASLLAVRLFIEMRQMGYRPAEPTGGTPSVQKKWTAEATRLFAALLVPWIRVHTDGSGMLADSFACQRLVPAGYETAWLLLGLREQSKDAELSALLRRLSRQCLEGASRLPIGTSWLQHTNWDAGGRPGGGRSGGSRPAEARGAAGPVDSRRLAREVWFGLRLLEDFPRL